MPAIDPGDRHVPIGDVEHRIAGHQRRRVPVIADPEVDQVEAGRQPSGVLDRSCVQVLRLHRHGPHEHLGGQRSHEAGQIAGRVPAGRDPLVDLVDNHPVPVHLQLAEGSQHQRWGAATADGQVEPAALGNGPLGRIGEQQRGCTGSLVETRPDDPLRHADTLPL